MKRWLVGERRSLCVRFQCVEGSGGSNGGVRVERGEKGKLFQVVPPMWLARVPRVAPVPIDRRAAATVDA